MEFNINVVDLDHSVKNMKVKIDVAPEEIL
jgi:hypothetical protein